MDKLIHEVKHYWNDHKKVVIVAGIILAVAIIL
jgi:predicted negative regulator of RcsB-dependent stress response